MAASIDDHALGERRDRGELFSSCVDEERPELPHLVRRHRRVQECVERAGRPRRVTVAVRGTRRTHTPRARIGKGSGVQRGEQLSCELRDLAHGLS
ncbi:hypothetical protein ACFPRL_34080 [Pseudoclavibacter helvolus]